MKRMVDLGDSRMAYVDAGEGERVFLLLHGNPTSSYLWRNVIPALTPLGRCIAPDLIGMGDSSKLPPGPGRYRFHCHREHLWRFIDAVTGTSCRLTLVVHDWGTELGFDWANHHRERVEAIAYMEGIVRPLEWSEWPEKSRALFQALRSPQGEEMVLERNVFVERILPGSVLHPLPPEVMDEYRRPFAASPDDRWPTLAWPREIPVDGEPADVVELVRDAAAWMADNDVPKLFVNAQPGAILTGPQREFCRRWRNQTEVTVPGIHFVQEDSGPEIGAAIARWVVRRDIEPAIDAYCAAWNESDARRRRQLLSAVWSEASVYVDPTVRLTGIDALVDRIAVVAARFPGSRIVRTSALDVHHGLVRFGWKRVLHDGSSRPDSIDIAELSADGKFSRMAGFFGPLAPLADL